MLAVWAGGAEAVAVLGGVTDVVGVVGGEADTVGVLGGGTEVVGVVEVRGDVSAELTWLPHAASPMIERRAMRIPSIRSAGGLDDECNCIFGVSVWRHPFEIPRGRASRRTNPSCRGRGEITGQPRRQRSHNDLPAHPAPNASVDAT
jgi:hypothetical protein